MRLEKNQFFNFKTINKKNHFIRNIINEKVPQPDSTLFSLT